MLPEAAHVLEDLQTVVAVEARRFRARQDRDETLTGDDAKALGAYTAAFVAAERAKQELVKDGVSELDRDALLAALVSELTIEELESAIAKKRGE